MTTDTPEDRAQRATDAVADLLSFPLPDDGVAEYPPVYDGSQTGFPTRADLTVWVGAVSRDGQFARVHFQCTVPGRDLAIPGAPFDAPLRDLKGFDWEPVIPEPEPLPEPTLPPEDPPTDDDGSGDGGDGDAGGSPVAGDDQQ